MTLLTRIALSLVVTLASLPSLLSAPPDVPKEPVKLSVGEDTVVTIKVAEGKKGAFRAAFDLKNCTFFRGYSASENEMVFLVRPKVTGEYRVVFWTVGEGESSELVIVGGTPSPVPPVPPSPVPPGPTPTPDPTAPLRVIFVYESSQAMTVAQQRVIFGEKVRQHLDANSKGWRRYDKDVDASNERDTDIKALWTAVKPNLTTVPCVVVARGTSAEILPLPTDEDSAIKLFTGTKKENK